MNILSHTERDWPEDALTDPDNGSYGCRCLSCGQSFTGHKHRMTCKVCAVKIEEEGKRRAALLEKAGLDAKKWLLMNDEEVSNMQGKYVQQAMMLRDMSQFATDLALSLKEIHDWMGVKDSAWSRNATELLTVAGKLGMLGPNLKSNMPDRSRNEDQN